jgi:hypothetical protein
VYDRICIIVSLPAEEKYLRTDFRIGCWILSFPVHFNPSIQIEGTWKRTIIKYNTAFLNNQELS